MGYNKDRTEFAAIGDGGSAVRYDRSGKDYLEYPPAVAATGERGCYVLLGRSGGLASDSTYKRALKAAGK